MGLCNLAGGIMTEPVKPRGQQMSKSEMKRQNVLHGRDIQSGVSEPVKPKYWKWEMRLVDLVNRNTRSNNIYYRVMSDTEKIEVIELAAYQAALDEIEKLKFELNEKHGMTADQIDEIQALRWNHGLVPEIVTEKSRYELLRCLFYHMENRDEWRKEAWELTNEIDKLKRELWYLKYQDGTPYPNGEI